MVMDGENHGFDPSHSGDSRQKYPERFSEVVEYESVKESPKAMKRVFEVGLEKGYITEDSLRILLEGMRNFQKNRLSKLLSEKGLTFDVFCEIILQTPKATDLGVPVNLTNMVDNEVFSATETFGVNEPTYFELLGDDLGDLRKKGNPSLLLLGSFGPYSSREFKEFAKKINAKSDIHVVDSYRRQKKQMEEGFADTDVNFVFADVRKMPFEDESHDLLASDFLLRSFRDEKDNASINEENFTELFKEVFRVLKPGGTYILLDSFVEMPGFAKTKDEFQQKLFKIVKLVGLKLVSTSDNFFFPFRKDVSSAKIDEGGSPKYENLVAHDPMNVGFKFVKPKTKEE